MRTNLLLAGLVGAMPILVPHTAQAKEGSHLTVTPSTSIDSEYMFPRQLLVVDSDGPLYHEGVEFGFGRASFAVDDYRYGASGHLKETDYTFSFTAACPLHTTCTADVAEWVTPTENVTDYKLNVSGGDTVTWGITLEHQDGETYEANLVEFEIGNEFHPITEWDWLTISAGAGVTYDAVDGSSGFFANVGPNVVIGNFTLSAGLEGFERVSGDGDRSGLSFGLSGSVPFNLF